MKRTETKTRKYKLDLSVYQVEVDEPVTDNDGKLIMEGKWPKTKKKTMDYPLKNNLSDNLRSVGMFKTGEEVAEAICLAKQIREAKADFIIIDEKEASVLKYAIDRLIALTADGKATVGGVVHEEMICRIFNMEIIEDEE